MSDPESRASLDHQSEPVEEQDRSRRRDALWLLLLLLLLLLIPALVCFAPGLFGAFGLTGLGAGRQGLAATRALQGEGSGSGGGGATGGDAASDGGQSPGEGVSQSNSACSECSQEPPADDPIRDAPLTPTLDISQIWFAPTGGGVCGMPCTQTSDCPLSDEDPDIYCNESSYCWNDAVCFDFGQPFSEEDFLEFACGLPCTQDSDCPDPGFGSIFCRDDGVCWLDNKCGPIAPPGDGDQSSTSPGTGTCGDPCSDQSDCLDMACSSGVCWDDKACLDSDPAPPPDGLCSDNGGIQWQGEVCVCVGFVDQVTVCQDGSKSDSLSDVPCTPDAVQCAPPPLDPNPGPSGGPSGPYCGNGIREDGEECDGSNLGCPINAVYVCSSSCTCEVVP